MVTFFSRVRASFVRDFAVLAVAVGALILVLGGWIAYASYLDYRQLLVSKMREGATRLEQAFVFDVEQASYLLESIARQALQDETRSLDNIAGFLRSFNTEGGVFHLFAWADADLRITATSAAGVLKRPLDISDRDYVKRSLIQPWKVHIGRPVEGRLTGKWILPIALGVSDTEGKFLGLVLASISIDKLTAQLERALAAPAIGFGMTTATFLTVAESARQADFINTYFPPTSRQKIAASRASRGELATESDSGGGIRVPYFQRLAGRPFVFLLSMDIVSHLPAFLRLLAERLMPLLLIASFALVVLLVIRNRVIRPLVDLTAETERIIRGEAASIKVNGPMEIVYLGRQIQQLSAYIQERRRIEFEQKAKLAFLKRAKDTAELSNRVKVDFLTSMSHEFRIPLNTISGFIELMKNEVYGAIGNERYKQYIVDIHSSVNGLQQLVGDVISLSRAESAQQDTNERPLDVQLVAARSIRALAEKMKEASVTVENRISEDMPRLRVDEARLRQIIQNLLSNALSHTPEGGSIVIDAQVVEDKLHQPVFEIVISDFGAKRLPGMGEDAAEVAPRRKNGAKGQKQGNLGVPLTRALVAMQQATLEVESPPGKATIIKVRYPKEKIVV